MYTRAAFIRGLRLLLRPPAAISYFVKASDIFDTFAMDVDNLTDGEIYCIKPREGRVTLAK